MKGEEKQVSQAVEKLGSDLEKNESVEYETLVKKATDGSLSLLKFLGMDEVRLETVYARAYRLYNTGKYKEASQIFRYLIAINPVEIKYFLGLAACCHLLKDYKAAVEVYLICDLLDSESPIPDFHASDCYLQMKDKVSALITLKMAIKKSGEKPEYQVLKSRALLTVDTLKKELKMTD